MVEKRKGGAKPERPEGARDTSVRLPLTAVEKATIVVAAQRAGLPIVKWIRRVIERAAEYERSL